MLVAPISLLVVAHIVHYVGKYHPLSANCTFGVQDLFIWWVVVTCVVPMLVFLCIRVLEFESVTLR